MVSPSPTLQLITIIINVPQTLPQAVPEDSVFTPLMTLYLTDKTTPEEVAAAKASGAVAFKLYPAGATTNSDSGVTDLNKVLPALRAMAEQGVLLLVHGEVRLDVRVDVRVHFVDHKLNW